MTKPEEMLYGAIRRREGLRLAQHHLNEALPSFLTETSQTSNPDPFALLTNDLASLKKKKILTLKMPPEGEIKLGKLSSLVLLIALAFMSALFFVVGFLTCYTLFPPYGGFSLTNRVSQVMTSSPSEASIPLPHNTPQNPYSMRQKQLAKASGRNSSTPSILEQAEQQTLSEAKFQAQSSVSQVLNNATNKLRDSLGSKLGGIVAPLTTGIAQRLVQQKSNQAFEKVRDGIKHTNENPEDTTSEINRENKTTQEGALPQNAVPSHQTSKNLYAIHVRDFADQSTAQEYVSDLKKRGFTDSYYSRLWGAQGIVYTVKAGHYKTFQDALSASKILREQGGQLTRIVPLTSDDLTQTTD